jgi:2-phosphinomethylmalic acid synthase
MVAATSIAAVRAGCAAINGTCLGKGERTGNAPLEQVLVHLIGMGYYGVHAPDLAALNGLVDLYRDLGEPVPPTYPLFGRDAHRTRAGIHADGLSKFWRMYAPFDVPRLLGRPFEVSLTASSGLSGLAFVIRQHLGEEVDKDDPRLRSLWDELMAEFDGGRVTAVAWEEISERARAVAFPVRA